MNSSLTCKQSYIPLGTIMSACLMVGAMQWSYDGMTNFMYCLRTLSRSRPRSVMSRDRRRASLMSGSVSTNTFISHSCVKERSKPMRLQTYSIYFTIIQYGPVIHYHFLDQMRLPRQQNTACLFKILKKVRSMFCHSMLGLLTSVRRSSQNARIPSNITTLAPYRIF